MFRISEDARAELLRLKADAQAELLYRDLRAQLGRLVRGEDDPTHRRRRYQQPPMFGFIVRGRTDDHLVLWGRGDDGIVEIFYIGPDL